ncbi:MAG: tetratricopeptide repeat protein [Bacteroidales bacterium]|nr:tetratricopeptide repeat protein [Bacteroidales bacterium]
MRPNPLLGLLFALIISSLISCKPSHSAFRENTTPHHFAELQQAKDLMDSNRTQAHAFLDSLETANATLDWSETERHEFLILLTEARYKNGALGNNSPDLHESAAFFDSLAQQHPNDKELRFIQAKAHYYLGTEDKLDHLDVAAASDFVNALQILREIFSDSQEPHVIRFTGLSYFRLGEILVSYNIQSAAIDAFEAAKQRFSIVNDTLGVAASIRNLGEVYQANKDYEKALAKFQEANHLWDFGDNLYDHAYGGIFFNHQQMDSACGYLERSFVNSGPYAKIDASAKLAEIYKEKGEKDKENYYTMFYVQNSIRETNRSSDKMEIEFIIEGLKEPVTPTEVRQWNPGVVILVVAVLLVIIILSSIIVHNRHRISHIEEHISTIEQIHREETEGKDNQIKTISKQLDATKQRLERQSPKIDFDPALDSFLHSPIAQKIHKAVDGKDIMTKSVSLYPNLKLSEVEFIEVVRTANKCFPDFSTHLLHDYHNLSTSDVRHCCLALLGLNDAEIAVLEGITYSGANRRTNRILSVMDEKSSLAECVINYLKSLYT